MWARRLWTGVAVAAAWWAGAAPAQDAPAQGPAALLLEGFEELHKVRTWPGKLEPVKEGDGVTEGRSAARAPAGQDVHVKVKADDLRRHAWLKLDSLTLQPLSHRFSIRARQQDTWVRQRTAYARAGKDTIALPLGMLSRNWPDGDIELTVTNASDQPVILDNLRLEGPAPPPPGCELLDFGPDGQVVWPGFQRAGADSPRVVWSGQVGINLSDAAGLPDPLGGDFVGPYLGTRVSDAFELVWPHGGSTGWLWLTHYAAARAQPAEYLFASDGKTLAGKRLSRAQMLGPDGLMEGIDGAWTPKWFDETYAPRFVELLRVGLKAGRTRFAVGNAQLAAAVLAPPEAREAAEAYVQQVQADLSRFRRQFVVGHRAQARCELVPTEADTQAGYVLLRPPPDEAFLPGWQPKDSDRAEKVALLAANGARTTAVFAVAPLRKTGTVTAALSPLRGADRRTLPVTRPASDVLFCATLPRVLEARCDRQPWILTGKHPPLEEREILLVVLQLSVPEDAPAGAYQGELRLSLGGATAAVPLEVEVAQVGPAAKELPTVGLLDSGWPAGFYSQVLTDGLDDPTRDGLRAKVRRQLLEHGNALWLPGPFLANDMRAHAGNMVSHLRDYPPKSAGGCTLFGVEQMLEAMQGAQVNPGTRQYEQGVNNVVNAARGAAGAAGIADYALFLGLDFDMNTVGARLRLAAAIRAAGGRPMVMLRDHYLRGLSENQRDSTFASLSGLIVANHQRDLPALLGSFKKRDPANRAYLYCERADRGAAGLFAAAAGADGVYVASVYMSGGTYNGFHLDGSGVLALQADGELAPTLAALAIQQGLDDFLLFRRAAALASRAADAKLDAGELAKALTDIRDHVAGRSCLDYDYHALRGRALAPSQIEAYRARLIRASAEVAGKLKAR